MRSLFMRLVPLMLPACMVDAPAPENSDQRLGANLSAWCEQTCGRLAECGSSDDSCPESCFEYFTETYADKSDVCTAAADRVMDCIETSSCTELTGEDPCAVTAEETRCFDSVGQVSCGAAYGGASANGGPFYCEVGLSDCSDGKEYALSCDGPGDPPDCRCLVNGDITGTFTPSRLVCPSDREAAQICGWPMVGPGEGVAVMPTRCQVAGGGGTAGGAGVSECGIEFDECSDGHHYAVDCSGPPGAVRCTCSIDATAVGTFDSPSGICQVAPGPDNGSVAANYACGFKLAPMTFE